MIYIYIYENNGCSLLSLRKLFTYTVQNIHKCLNILGQKDLLCLNEVLTMAAFVFSKIQ